MPFHLAVSIGMSRDSPESLSRPKAEAMRIVRLNGGAAMVFLRENAGAANNQADLAWHQTAPPHLVARSEPCLTMHHLTIQLRAILLDL